MSARNLFFPYAVTPYGNSTPLNPSTYPAQILGIPNIPVWDLQTWDSDPPFDDGTYSYQNFYPAMTTGSGLTRFVCGDGTLFPLNLGQDIDRVMKYYWRSKKYNYYWSPNIDFNPAVTIEYERCNAIDGMAYGGITNEQELCVGSIWGSNNPYAPPSQYIDFQYVKGDDGNYWARALFNFGSFPPPGYSYSAIASWCYVQMAGNIGSSLGPPDSPTLKTTIPISDLGIGIAINIYNIGTPIDPLPNPYGEIEFTEFFTYDGYYDSTTGDTP